MAVLTRFIADPPLAKNATSFSAASGNLRTRSRRLTIMLLEGSMNWVEDFKTRTN